MPGTSNRDVFRTTHINSFTGLFKVILLAGFNDSLIEMVSIRYSLGKFVLYMLLSIDICWYLLIFSNRC